MEGGSGKHEHPCLADLKEGTAEKAGDICEEKQNRRGERKAAPANETPVTSGATLLNLSLGVMGRCSAFL